MKYTTKRKHSTVRKTNETFLKEVEAIGKGEYEALDKYINSGTKIRFNHKVCGRIFTSSPANFLNGFMCVDCSPKIKARSLSLQVVKDRLEKISPDIEITSDEYKNNRTHLKCKCKKCGHEYKSTWASLKKGISCQGCSNGNVKWTISSLKEHVKTVSDSELLSSSYRGNRDVLDFKCGCGNLYKRRIEDFNRSGKTCAPCSFKARGKLLRTPKEEVREIIESEGGTLHSIYIKHNETHVNMTDGSGYKHSGLYRSFKKYGWGTVFGTKNSNFKCNVKKYIKETLPTYKLETIFVKNKFVHIGMHCDKGHYYETNLYTTIAGNKCRKCGYKLNMGANNPRYNPLLTDEEREKSRYELYGKSPRVWARNVHKKHNYKCIVCDSRKDLNAHHLDGWNIAKHMRFSVGNGVTVCETHHIDFHKEYGYGDNTKEQFEEYLLNKKTSNN